MSNDCAVTETDTIYTVDVAAPFYLLFVPTPTIWHSGLSAITFDVAVSPVAIYDVAVASPVCYSVAITDIAPVSAGGTIGLDMSSADNSMYLALLAGVI